MEEGRFGTASEIITKNETCNTNLGLLTYKIVIIYNTNLAFVLKRLGVDLVHRYNLHTNWLDICEQGERPSSMIIIISAVPRICSLDKFIDCRKDFIFPGGRYIRRSTLVPSI